MSKKEQNKIKVKHVFEALNNNDIIRVTKDFHDYEGHGYWTGIVQYMGMEFSVDLSRSSFGVIVYEVPGSVFYKVSADELDEVLGEIIEDALQRAEVEIMMNDVNIGLGLV